MIPILFSPESNVFNNNGIGALHDALSCSVTEVRNGLYELSMTYSVYGKRYNDIQEDCIIVAKPNQTGNPQAFRVYSISKPTNGVVTINAEHISYQLSSIPVAGFSADNVSDALSKIATNSTEDNPFTFWTDKETNASYSKSIPLSARSILGGVDGSILDVYGGEYEFDNYTVKLHNNRGNDNGVLISYGKNLTGITCDTDASSIVTGVLGYWQSGEDTVIGNTQYSDKQLSSYKRVKTLDCSANFTDKPTIEQINNYCASYLKSQYQSPKVSMSVEFINLGDSEEYKQYRNLESVSLCDTVRVKYPMYGVDVKTKVVKTVYNVLLERYSKIELGSVQANIANTIADQQKAQTSTVSKSLLEQVIKSTTNAITGNSGGYVVLYPPNNPQEILIMDTNNVNTATKVWRWNSGGLGYSSTGYDGPYSTAVTMDGQIVADFISAGTLQGIKIVGDFGSIGGFTMSKNSLTAEWSYTYPEFTEDDARKVQSYILGQTELTDDEKKKYDTNFDGLLQSQDARTIQKIALGVLPRTVTGTVTIGSSDATEVIKILGTSGAMEGQKFSIGIGGLQAAAAVLDRISVNTLYGNQVLLKGDSALMDINGNLSVGGTTNIKGYLKTSTVLAETEYFDNGYTNFALPCPWALYDTLVVGFFLYNNMWNSVAVPTSYFAQTNDSSRVQFFWPNENGEYVEVYKTSDSQVYVGLSSTALVDKHIYVKIWGV